METKDLNPPPSTDADRCPCGSGKSFSSCCQPILTGNRRAAAAEELMRARFTAHALHDFEFLHRTYKETAARPFSRATEVEKTQWTRLAIHSHAPGRSADVAYVDFSAYGVENGAEIVLHEKAEFVRENGAWIYARALREGPAPIRSTAPKPGRNDPCPCGSGKKFKQCCLGKI
jgi:SEC-C motif-containing protein